MTAGETANPVCIKINSTPPVRFPLARGARADHTLLMTTTKLSRRELKALKSAIVTLRSELVNLKAKRAATAGALEIVMQKFIANHGIRVD